jgi:hypothetical protein
VSFICGNNGAGGSQGDRRGENKDQTRGSEWGGGEGQKIGTIK